MLNSQVTKLRSIPALIHKFSKYSKKLIADESITYFFLKIRKIQFAIDSNLTRCFAFPFSCNTSNV